MPEQYEVQAITKSGRALPLEVNPRVIRYKGEPPTMAVMRDITERKRAERELGRRDAILAALGAASLFSSLLGCDEVEGCPFRFSALLRLHREYQFHPTKMGSSPTSPGGEPLVISRHGYLASRMVENSGDGS